MADSCMSNKYLLQCKFCASGYIYSCFMLESGAGNCGSFVRVKSLPVFVPTKYYKLTLIERKFSKSCLLGPKALHMSQIVATLVVYSLADTSITSRRKSLNDWVLLSERYVKCRSFKWWWIERERIWHEKLVPKLRLRVGMILGLWLGPW